MPTWPMKVKLNARQEEFALAIAQGATQADAYRMAYRPPPSTTSNSVYQSASKIAALAKVRSRVGELQINVQIVAFNRHRICAESLIAETEDARQIAIENNDPAGMIGATRLKAQLTGLLVKHRENALPPLAEVPDEQVLAEIRRLRAEREVSPH